MVALTPEYIRLARIIAESVDRRISKDACVNLCDLESAANFGLFQASITFREDLGSFKGYAKFRIRGAILDYLRSVDSVGRTERKRIKARAELNYRRQFDLEAVVALASEELGPEQLAIRNQNRARIRTIVQSLPDRTQQFLRMRHNEDLTLQTIGAAWNLTEGRLCQIQKDTHEKLRTLLVNAEL